MAMNPMDQYLGLALAGGLIGFAGAGLYLSAVDAVSSSDPLLAQVAANPKPFRYGAITGGIALVSTDFALDAVRLSRRFTLLKALRLCVGLAVAMAAGAITARMIESDSDSASKLNAGAVSPSQTRSSGLPSGSEFDLRSSQFPDNWIQEMPTQLSK